MDIEEVADSTPEKIARGWPDPALGLLPYQARALCFAAGVPAEQRNAVADIAQRLYGVYGKTDATLLEINPLFIQADGSVLAGDAKLDIDDNALYRQTELRDWKEVSPDEEVEERARALGFSYVQLDGDVGIIGNGAGLVMSTLDAVKNAGGHAANFLDVGGGAKEAVVKAALEIVLANKKVKSILINIFGGITRGDEVARGLVEARAQQVRDVPMVVRIVGTNAAEAAAILQAASFETASSLDDAAAKAVVAAGSVS
jgi:succinyl-CoA synthetase beta subunit